VPSGFANRNQAQQAGRITMKGTAILKTDAMIGAMRAARKLCAASTRCHYQKVRRQ